MVIRPDKPDSAVSARDFSELIADTKSVFTDVCAHRIVMTPQARMSAIKSEDICKEILRTVAAPNIRS